jgi:phage terminase large subunit
MLNTREIAQRVGQRTLARTAQTDAGQGAAETYAVLYGGAARFWDSKAHEIILHGPFETGKTFAALTKLHKLNNIYPGAQSLMVRETYKSLLSSACVTFEKKVLPVPPDAPGSEVHKFGGEKPDFYQYSNGSRIWVGGLDNPDKFLSAEFDFVYVNQAEEIQLDSWEKLVGRATGRAGNAPFTQVMGDCNPGPPNHWILERANSGLELIQQMHENNPKLFDQETGEMTEQGRISIETLDMLTGIRHQRGRLGLWVAAEGAIYDNFSIEHNVTNDAEYVPGKPIIWGVDDGYAHGEGPGNASYHPRVFLLGQVTAQGGVNIFCEYYKTQELSEKSIENVLAVHAENQWPLPDIAYIDSSAVELKARLWGYVPMTAGATHLVHEGIKNVRRLVCDGQDVRLLKIHPRCKNLIREMQSYRYDDKSSVANIGEPKPLKVDDHGPDSLRYLTWTLRYEG